MKHTGWLAGLIVASLGASASAHFELDAPAAYSEQDALGTPQKSVPCGQADPGSPVVETNAVTTYSAGETITVTVTEKVFHPGHFRVALAQDMTSLPDDPAVTAGSTECGTAVIEDPSTPGVLADDMLDHTSPLQGAQSFQVTLPAGMTCTHCTLQVEQFMSDHSKNNPGGCFYHHCATVDIVPAGTGPDAGSSAGTPDAGSGSGGSGGGSSSGGGGCDAGGAGALLPGLALGLAAFGPLAARRRRRRVAT